MQNGTEGRYKHPKLLVITVVITGVDTIASSAVHINNHASDLVSLCLVCFFSTRQECFSNAGISSLFFFFLRTLYIFEKDIQ